MFRFSINSKKAKDLAAFNLKSRISDKNVGLVINFECAYKAIDIMGIESFYETES
jgi:hypothetical protein